MTNNKLTEIKETLVKRYVRCIKGSAEAKDLRHEVSWEARISEIEILYFQMFGENLEYVAVNKSGTVVYRVFIDGIELVTEFAV